MPLEELKLDERNFEDLLREARSRIPRYCPQWTDYNDSDPGMALVQLFAWFTELMIHQINQVPERNYREFLKMLNLTPMPAQPAITHVVMNLSEGATIVNVLPQSRFEVPGAENGEPVVFETTKGIDLCPYKLDTVQVLDGMTFEDCSQNNQLGNSSFRPFGWNPQVGNALYLGFDRQESLKDLDGPAFPDKLVFRVFMPENKASTSVSRRPADPGALVWEYQSKNDLVDGELTDRWRPLSADDRSSGFTDEGDIIVSRPDKTILATRPGRPPADGKERYWLRCRLARRDFGGNETPEIAFIRANVVEVKNLETIQDEVLAESDGFKEHFTLRRIPVDRQSLNLVTLDTQGTETSWECQDDLFSSQREDRHYTLEPGSGLVTFGDGSHGRKPSPGDLVIARTYRAGGGANGNIQKKAINAPPAGVIGIESAENPRSATGGKDKESIDELKTRAPLALSGDSRAVTASDYVRFALKVRPGVGQAIVLDCHHPRFPMMKIPGAVSVVIVPDMPLPRTPGQVWKPQPTPELLARVRAELDQVRVVGTELFVQGPRYIEITIRIEVIKTATATAANVKERVREMVEDYLSAIPLHTTPTDTADGSRKDSQPPVASWKIGTSVFYPSRLYSIILDTKDAAGKTKLVEAVHIVEAKVGDAKVDSIPFQPDELPTCIVEVTVDDQTTRDR